MHAPILRDGYILTDLPMNNLINGNDVTGNGAPSNAS